MLRYCFLVVLICLMAVGVSLAEFQINTYTDSEQTTPAIAGDAQGNFVIAWASKYQDGDWRGIYGQRFDLYGMRVGDEFAINITTTGNQINPNVAMNAAGDFVVVWYGPDGSEEGIYGRRYDANGQPLAGEFLVNSVTDSRQMIPRVAMNDNGAFVIVWESWYGIDAHHGEWQLRGRLYNAAGVAQGQEFTISQTPHAGRSHVAMNQTGEFIVVFGRDEDGAGGVYLSVRRYYANGTPKGNEEPLSEDIDGFGHPWISMDKASNYVVVWSLSLSDVYAQLFDSNDNAIGDSFVVNTSVGVTRPQPRVSMNEDGQFAIVWNNIDGADDVFGRFYHSGGIPDSNKFQLSDYTVGDQGDSAVLMQPSGRFIAAWQSDGPDGSEEGIFAKFRPETFAGDFTGNGKVNFPDLALLSSRWLQNEPVLDIAPPDSVDGIVNFLDFACLSADWFQMQP